MSFVTRSKVYHNGLDESIHRLEVDYGNEKLVYVFSSEYYKEIFTRKQKDNRSKINESLSKRFGVEINFDMLADIKLYSTTEKRGFLIIGKEEIKWLNTIKLSGVNLIIKS